VRIHQLLDDVHDVVLFPLMTTFGGPVDRATAFTLAARDIGKLLNLPDHGVALIGFTERELKRRDVAPLINGQQLGEVCTAGEPYWFQARIWFEIGAVISKSELKEFQKQYRKAWETRYGAAT
jgi:hypothetical protein